MTKLKADEALCPECAEPVKMTAAKCKHCGHRFTQEEIDSRLQAGRATAKKNTIGCLVIVGLLIALVAMCSDGTESKTDPAIAAADRQKGFHCLSSWDGESNQMSRAVQAQLRDPDSFEHIETRITPNKEGKHTVFLKYRARNGFGGMNVEQAIGQVDHESCEVIGTPLLG